MTTLDGQLLRAAYLGEWDTVVTLVARVPAR
jgi:hypothetical protein